MDYGCVFIMILGECGVEIWEQMYLQIDNGVDCVFYVGVCLQFVVGGLIVEECEWREVDCLCVVEYVFVFVVVYFG